MNENDIDAEYIHDYRISRNMRSSGNSNRLSDSEGRVEVETKMEATLTVIT